MSVSRKLSFTDKLIYINLLAFVAEIITYDVVTIFFFLDLRIFLNPYPILPIWTTNISAKAWIKKAAAKNNNENGVQRIVFSKDWIKKVAKKINKGKELQRILCSIMIDNPVELKPTLFSALTIPFLARLPVFTQNQYHQFIFTF